MALPPCMYRVVVVAMTEDMITGVNVAMCQSPRTISRAKSAPAMGALKVAAMPPAAPHPRRVRTLLEDNLKNWAVADPMAAPIWAIGPSRPADPPVPMVMAEAMPRIKIVRASEYPAFLDYGFHDFRDTVAFCLSGEDGSKGAENQSAQRRQKGDKKGGHIPHNEPAVPSKRCPDEFEKVDRFDER